jgi:hypothetical protein
MAALHVVSLAMTGELRVDRSTWMAALHVVSLAMTGELKSQDIQRISAPNTPKPVANRPADDG